VIYLDLDDLLHIAERALGHTAQVRDYGLLESALARPRATAFGEDAYPDIDHKAAALLHSLATNHALIDGNKRLALAASLAFYGTNGLRLTITNDEAYTLVMRVAAGQQSDITQIATLLEQGTTPR
jgi:death on curing protein